jgi:hypothetical protein
MRSIGACIRKTKVNDRVDGSLAGATELSGTPGMSPGLFIDAT